MSQSFAGTNFFFIYFIFYFFKWLGDFPPNSYMYGAVECFNRPFRLDVCRVCSSPIFLEGPPWSIWQCTLDRGYSPEQSCVQNTGLPWSAISARCMGVLHPMVLTTMCTHRVTLVYIKNKRCVGVFTMNCHVFRVQECDNRPFRLDFWVWSARWSWRPCVPKGSLWSISQIYVM